MENEVLIRNTVRQYCFKFTLNYSSSSIWGNYTCIVPTDHDYSALQANMYIAFEYDLDTLPSNFDAWIRLDPNYSVLMIK